VIWLSSRCWTCRRLLIRLTTQRSFVVYIVWFRGFSLRLVHFIPRRPHAAHPLRKLELASCCCQVRSPTGIGPGSDPVSTLHGGPAATHWTTEPAPTYLCCWRTDYEFCQPGAHSTIGYHAFHVAAAKIGTLCRLTSHLHPHYRHSNGDWKMSFSSAVIHPTVPIYSRYCLAMHENYRCWVTLQLFALRHVNCRSFLPTYVLTYLLTYLLIAMHCTIAHYTACRHFKVTLLVNVINQFQLH